MDVVDLQTLITSYRKRRNGIRGEYLLDNFRIIDIINLSNKYGGNTTLSQLIKIIQGNRIYKCPKCNGEGYIEEEYNGYPEGLPDSGCVYKPAFRKISCDLCDGFGFTEKQYKPRMVQDGWEEDIDGNS